MYILIDNVNIFIAVPFRFGRIINLLLLWQMERNGIILFTHWTKSILHSPVAICESMMPLPTAPPLGIGSVQQRRSGTDPDRPDSSKLAASPANGPHGLRSTPGLLPSSDVASPTQ